MKRADIKLGKEYAWSSDNWTHDNGVAKRVRVSGFRDAKTYRGKKTILVEVEFVDRDLSPRAVSTREIREPWAGYSTRWDEIRQAQAARKREIIVEQSERAKRVGALLTSLKAAGASDVRQHRSSTRVAAGPRSASRNYQRGPTMDEFRNWPAKAPLSKEPDPFTDAMGVVAGVVMTAQSLRADMAFGRIEIHVARDVFDFFNKTADREDDRIWGNGAFRNTLFGFPLFGFPLFVDDALADGAMEVRHIYARIMEVPE